MSQNMFLISFLLTLAAIEGIHAVDYVVTNTAGNTDGGAIFDKDIGVDYSRQTLSDATNFIWGLFQQNDDGDRKNVQTVSLFIDDIDGVASTSGTEIHVSARYIKSYSGDVKTEITGVLYHEMTHVWQWDGNHQTPSAIIEGIADFVRLTAKYAPSTWVQPGEGTSWNQSSDVTARFLDYCNSLKDGFVADLNKKMRNGYDSNYFNELLGKSIDELWSDYKAKYGN